MVPGYFDGTTSNSCFSWGDGDNVYVFVGSSWELQEKTPKLAGNVEWFGPDMMPGDSKPGNWFYNTRDGNKMGEISRVFDWSLLDSINNGENPFTRQKWGPDVLAKFTVPLTGGGKEYTYKNRKYLVKTGPRGGKYILTHSSKKNVSSGMLASQKPCVATKGGKVNIK